MDNTEKPASTDDLITQPRDNWWTRLIRIRYLKSKVDERAAKKQKESPVDRAARVTATATKWIAIFTFVSVAVSVGTFLILKSQLREMHDGGVDTRMLAEAARDSTALQLKLAEGNQAAWLVPSAQNLDRNLLRFGVQNTGGVGAENVTVSVQVKLIKTSDNHTLWMESFAFEKVKYLPPKENTNRQSERPLPSYTRRDFNLITQNKETIVLNWSATYDNGFKRIVQQGDCAQYIALFKPPQTAATPQWVGCEGSPQLQRMLQPPSEQWSLQ